MARLKKYDVLTEWLRERNRVNIRISFGELDNIVKLPKTAYLDRSSWANCTTTNATSFQRSWQEAGYKVSSINMQEQWVEFSKSSKSTCTDYLI